MVKTFVLWSLVTFLVGTNPPAEAQQAKVYRVGVVTAGGAWYEVIDGLRVGLRQLGLKRGNSLLWRSKIRRAMRRWRRRRQKISKRRKSI